MTAAAIADRMMTDLRAQLRMDMTRPSREYVERLLEECRGRRSYGLWRSRGHYFLACAKVAASDGSPAKVHEFHELARQCKRCAEELIAKEAA